MSFIPMHWLNSFYSRLPDWLRRDLIWSERADRFPRPSPMLTYWTLTTYVLAILVHLGNLPFWLSILIILGIGIRIGMELKRTPLPSTHYTSLAACVVIACVYLNYHSVLGRDPGTALVAGFTLVKFFELRGQRDLAFLIFCGYFLVTSALLYSQGFELFVYCLILFWLLTAVLLRAFSGDLPDHRVLVMLSRSGGLLARALPLTVFLFFLLPRYSGSLEFRLGDATLGFTDTLNPGSFDNLIIDDSPAFRVKFSGGRLPTQNDMYWRGVVLFVYKDNEWTVGLPPNKYEVSYKYPKELLTHQVITVWPHNHSWLFALDNPESFPTGTDIVMDSGRVLKLRAPRTVNHKLTYEVDSVIDRVGDIQKHRIEVSGPPLDPKDRHFGYNKETFEFLTHVDIRDINPLVIALAHKLAGPNPTPISCANNIMKYFHDEGFVYSQQPPFYSDDEQAEFLLKKKIGYCEHYASAFALLMRLNGFPARVVLGYHGAEKNLFGDFYMVSQADAHAWVEILNPEDRLWVRYDPVTALDNFHINTTMAIQAAQEYSVQVANYRFNLFSAKDLPQWMEDDLENLKMHRELWEAEWDQLVLSYDSDTQEQLADNVSSTLGTTGFIIGAVIFLLVLCVISFIWWKRRTPVNPVERDYRIFCRALKKEGTPREPWESPLVYTRRAAVQFPELAGLILGFGEIVSRVRYHPQPVEEDPVVLRTLLTQLRQIFREEKARKEEQK